MRSGSPFRTGIGCLVAGLVFAAVACSHELARDVDDDTSRAIVSALRSEGIDAERRRSHGGWRVDVPNGDHERSRPIAADILDCPPPPAAVPARSAVLGADLQERAAAIARERAHELRRQLSALPVVRCATVSVRSSTPTISRPDVAPQASVALEAGRGSDAPALRRQATAAAEALGLELAAFALSARDHPPAEPPRLSQVGPWRVSSADAPGLRLVLGLALAGLILAVVTVARHLLLWRRRRVQ